MMRSSGNEDVTRVAFESTARQLAAERSRDLLAQIAETATA